MAYKTRTPTITPAVATERLRTVLTLASQANITTQNLGKPRKNTTGYQ
jgi:hypothetical protein